ncbi:efflux RND transporter periplasmic adaptor subunit [Psychroserpens mesophilus]|uniref:efflux RND transporter periplasmic adaptor subunit n=1 Tax=Psychroserpens mesophilus TaxID=325473 RepID=UPI00058ADE47|nr:efflux RND transporter periplasmic adaptor subunit [Psychroserpens mesophilus]
MKRITYIACSTLILLFFTNCKDSENTTDAIISEQEDNRIQVSKVQFNQNNMALATIENKSVPVKISVNGMIDVPPENKAVVNSTVGGYIKTTPFLEGDIVKKGQALVTLENPEFITMQQEYMEVKEQLNYLKAEYDRQQTMLDENITSQKSFLRAESSYKTALATYNGLKKQLVMLNISPASVEKGNISSVVTLYAPISGSISKVNVTRGTYVSPATSIIEIIDNSHIHLELSVFEKDIMNVKKGQKITFKIPEASENTFQGEVHLVGTTISENRTIKVHGHPIDDSNSFLTGMFVNADIITAEKEAHVLPESAIIEIENNYYVLVLNETTETDYYFSQIKVNIGNTVNGYTEVSENSEIKARDQLLIKGAFNLIGID